MYKTPAGGMLLPEPPSAGRKVTIGGKHRFSGTLVFGEGQGRAMEVESHTEMQVALVMLARRDVIDLENKVPFLYKNAEGVLCTHYFDFRVSMRNGSRIALFVEAARKRQDPVFQEKARGIAAQVTPDFADRVGIMTEKDLDPVEVHNAELIHSVRLPDPEVDAAARRAVAGLLGAARIGDLVDWIGFHGRGFRSIVRLIRTHELELATHDRIAHEAFVQRRAS